MAEPIRSRDLIRERREAQLDLVKRIRALPQVPDHVLDVLEGIVDPGQACRDPAGPVRPSIAAIKVEVVAEFGVARRALEGPSRYRVVVRPRQVAMYLSARLAGKSLPQIGRAFGRRDHTTALHAVRKVESLIAADPEFKARVDRIASRFITL